MQQAVDDRDVIIVYDNVQIKDSFPINCTLDKMIKLFFTDQAHLQTASNAFKQRGKQFQKLLNYQSIQLLLNMKQQQLGQPCNKSLRLDQYKKTKRLRFYINKKQNKQSNKSNISQNEKFDNKQNQLQICLGNSNGNIQSSFVLKLADEKYQTIKDLLSLIKQKFNIANKTQFILKHPDQQEVFTDINTGTNLRQFVRKKKLKKIIAIPVYVAG